MSSIMHCVNENDETTCCICSKRMCALLAVHYNILYMDLLNCSNVANVTHVTFEEFSTGMHGTENINKLGLLILLI
jgi:hypothetical protein